MHNLRTLVFNYLAILYKSATSKNIPTLKIAKKVYYQDILIY